MCLCAFVNFDMYNVFTLLIFEFLFCLIVDGQMLLVMVAIHLGQKLLVPLPQELPWGRKIIAWLMVQLYLIILPQFVHEIVHLRKVVTRKQVQQCSES